MILIDPAVGSKEYLPLFPKGRAAIGKQQHADFIFIGNTSPQGKGLIGVELKKLSTGDFFTSFTSNRLTGFQLPRMAETFQKSYLLIEGNYKCDKGSGDLLIYRKYGWIRQQLKNTCWRYDGFMNALESLSQFGGIQVRFTKSPYETMRWLLGLEGYWSKAFESHSAFQGVYTGAERTLTGHRANFGRKTLTMLPGVKWGLSGKIYNHFCKNGRCRDIMQALLNFDRKEWLKIPGLGKKRVDDIETYIKKNI